MKAMVLTRAKSPLELLEVPIPTPGPHELLIRVHTCGVCRTDLHIADGELDQPKLPLILGHQVVGTVASVGTECRLHREGERVGVPWLGGTCGACPFCLSERENLCAGAVYTGYQRNGGFAAYCTADERYVLPIPDGYADAHAAPLLCAGVVGYRALSFARSAKRVGFYGFGSSAHILIQVARSLGKEVYVFLRERDPAQEAWAQELGAAWVGTSDALPPCPLDAALIFAPDGRVVPYALAAVEKGGSVVCAGIHMSDIPSLAYSLLWEERVLRSVANLTRQDGAAFFALASQTPLQTRVTTYPLERANQALDDLREGRLLGSAVLVL